MTEKRMKNVGSSIVLMLRHSVRESHPDSARTLGREMNLGAV